MCTYVHCSSVSWTKKDLVIRFYILPGLTSFPALLTGDLLQHIKGRDFGRTYKLIQFSPVIIIIPALMSAKWIDTSTTIQVYLSIHISHHTAINVSLPVSLVGRYSCCFRCLSEFPVHKIKRSSANTTVIYTLPLQ